MQQGIAALRAADQIGDADAMGELLAPNVVCRSPFASSVRFEGRDEVVALHRDVFDILEDRDSGEPLVNESSGSFNFSGRVRGTPVDGMILATFDEQGQISELKIFIRPLLAMSAMFRALPPRVSRRRGGPVKGFMTAMGGWLFALIARPIEKLAPFLIPHSGALPTRHES
ncbi:MAG: nuclear transport factor 2 family protein [Rhodococcus sp. (in: high G+C Gram-positive bacteria)]